MQLPGNVLGMIERIKSNNALKDDPIERAKRTKKRINEISHGYKHNEYHDNCHLSAEELEKLKLKISKQIKREKAISLLYGLSYLSLLSAYCIGLYSNCCIVSARK